MHVMEEFISAALLPFFLQYSLEAHVSASHQLDATSNKIATKSLLRRALFGDKMEKNAMGGACSMYGACSIYGTEMRSIHAFGGET